jgi:hypothetical protein
MALLSERRFISTSKITSGMFVEFSYRKVKDNATKTYIALVIDPNRDGYLHAILVNDLPDQEIIKLITQLGNLTYDPTQRDQPVTDLQSDDAYRRYTTLQGKYQYRTFLVPNISGLRQILIGGIS